MKIHEDEFVYPFGEVEALSKPNFGNEVFAESFLIGHWIHSVEDADKVSEKYLRGVRNVGVVRSKTSSARKHKLLSTIYNSRKDNYPGT